ncbi:ATP-binding protein [Gemmatimonas sp.]|jgi:signal transduction histidine kinase|uniref:ATP-binding protein n=1 Tax=Gemmatimonas sp. TaxID=1962908 RepID=UPI00262DE759|nr:ATP-binding protein [Gemmatimonas sp.]
MPLSQTSLTTWSVSAERWSTLGTIAAEHRLVRVLLLVLGLLGPLNLPFSVPPLGRDASPGWFATSAMPSAHASELAAGASTSLRITRVSRRARQAGVLPGDVLVAVNGVPVTLATLAEHRARAVGKLVALDLQRRGDSVRVQVQVDAATIGYRVYTTYVLLLTCLSWLVGMALIASRGSTAFGLLTGAALLLIPPIAFSNGVPGTGLLLTSVRWLWHMEASAFRLFVPALLLHALAIAIRRPTWRSPRLWLGVYTLLGALLLLVTDLGRDPLAWARPGLLRELRMLVGFLLETVTALSAIYMLLRPEVSQGVTIRIVYGAIAAVMLSASVFSSTTLVLGSWSGEEFVSGVNSVATLFLPLALALHFFSPERLDDRVRNAPALATWSFAIILSAVHGLVIFASVAVVLNGSGQDLGGNEWLLFSTVVAATLLPAPAFRWLRATVDRRLMSRWVRAESNAQEFVYELSQELDSTRIARRIAAEIPALLDVSSAELFLVGEPVHSASASGAIGAATDVRFVSATELEAMRAADTQEGVTVFPVWGLDGVPIAVLRIGARTDGRPIDLPARVLITTIRQGVGAALAAAKAHIDLRRAGQELATAERIAAVGSLSGGLAHEIKNPLAGLKMGVYVLRRDGVDPVKLQRLERDVGRIDDLVSGLLRFTSDRADQADEVRLVDLRLVAAACVRDLRIGAEDRGIEIVEEYPNDVVLQRGSLLQFRLILTNLVSNAVESIGGAGRVVLTLRDTYDRITLTVGDTGAGIPPDIVPRVFDLHFTTKQSGTGIGLALVRREVERLGGYIEVVETSTRGTMMCVSLPRCPEALVYEETVPHDEAAVPDHR